MHCLNVKEVVYATFYIKDRIFSRMAKKWVYFKFLHLVLVVVGEDPGHGPPIGKNLKYV